MAAQFNLGFLFEKGLGVAQDYAQAARWYMKVAEQGDEEAQYSAERCGLRGFEPSRVMNARPRAG